MFTRKPAARVVLNFMGKDYPCLEETEQLLPPDFSPDKACKCRRGKRAKGRKNVFLWGPGPKALAIFFVSYADWCSRNRNPHLFVFSGEHGDPADTLETTVLQKDTALDWLKEMFDVEANHSILLLRIVRRLNPRKTSVNRPFEHGVQVENFPPDALKIIWDNRVLSTPAEFEQLLKKLQAQWKTQAHVEPLATPAPTLPQTIQPLLSVPQHSQESLTANTLPFSVISPSTASFEKPRQIGHGPPQFAYRRIYYEQMPHLSPFASVKDALTKHRCAVLRGSRGSGRTTLAFQLAMDFLRNCGYALYWDLAATDILPGSNQTALEHLGRFSSVPCLIVLDNIRASMPTTTAIYHAWTKAGIGMNLLLVDIWAPLTFGPIHSSLPVPPTRISDLHFTLDNFIRVYEFWKSDYASKRGKLLPHKIFHHLFGASLGRFCSGLATCARVRALAHDVLSAYDSGELVIDLKKGCKRIKPKKTSEIPIIRDYLIEHPQEQGCAGPLSKLISAMEEHRLSESSSYVRAYSDLLDHPILKWFYLLEPFQDVLDFLVRAREQFPSILKSLCDALQQDSQFSFRMASRVIDPLHSLAPHYISFADEFLPVEHKAHVVECLYNAGPGLFSDCIPPRDLRILLQHLRFIHDYLPEEFLSRLVETWTKPSNYQRLQVIVSCVAATDHDLLSKVTSDEMMLRLMSKQMLQEIAANPQRFTHQCQPAAIQVGFQPSPVTKHDAVQHGPGEDSTKLNANESAPFVSRADSGCATTLTPDSVDSPPLPIPLGRLSGNVPQTTDCGQARWTTGELLKTPIGPFRLIEPSMECFRKPEDDARAVMKPTYREVFEKNLPELGPFRPALDAIVGPDSLAILRGPKGSGKTTMALQLAAHLAGDEYNALYLDLSNTLPPDAAEHATDILRAQAPNPVLFVIDNANVDKSLAARLHQVWERSSGRSKMVFITRWSPPGSGELGIPLPHPQSQIVDIRTNAWDLGEVYKFWQCRIWPAVEVIPSLNARTYLFVGGSIRKLQEILSSPRGKTFSAKPLTAYEGQGVKIRFRNARAKRYIALIPYLGKHLKLNPHDRTFFDYTVAEVVEAQHDPKWKPGEFFMKAYSDLPRQPTARWKLLIDDFDDVLHFLRSAWKIWPSVYNSFCECLNRERGFSWDMAVRATHPDHSLQYVQWAWLHLPTCHVEDIAECFYNLGPAYTASRIIEIHELGALSQMFRFIEQWLPERYMRRLVERWSEPENESLLRELMAGRYNLTTGACQNMQAFELIRVLISEQSQRSATPITAKGPAENADPIG